MPCSNNPKILWRGGRVKLRNKVERKGKRRSSPKLKGDLGATAYLQKMSLREIVVTPLRLYPIIRAKLKLQHRRFSREKKAPFRPWTV